MMNFIATYVVEVEVELEASNEDKAWEKAEGSIMERIERQAGETWKLASGSYASGVELQDVEAQ